MKLDAIFPAPQAGFLDSGLGMHRISGRPNNPAFFDIRYPVGYQIALPDIR
jgi:hypothetical protein